MSDDDEDEGYDYDDEGFFSFITPTNLFVACSILFLIIYIGYDRYYSNSYGSTSYICCAICGIFLGVGAIKFLGSFSSTIEWGISIIMTFFMALFYYIFMI